MNWWRAHHGIATDPKYAVVLRHIASQCVTDRLVTTRAEILAVWVWLIDFSSQNEPRGSIAGVDSAQIAVTLDIPDGTVESIINALSKFGMITDNLLKSWDKRQPQREDDSAARTRQWRDKKRDNVTRSDAVVTHSDAVTPSRERPRDLLSSSLTSITNQSTDNGNGSVSVESVSVYGSYKTDETFSRFVIAATQFWGSELIEEDLSSAWMFSWKRFDFEQKLDATKKLQSRIEHGEDPQFVTRLPKYLENGAWKRPPRAARNGLSRIPDQKSKYREIKPSLPPED